MYKLKLITACMIASAMTACSSPPDPQIVCDSNEIQALLIKDIDQHIEVYTHKNRLHHTAFNPATVIDITKNFDKVFRNIQGDLSVNDKVYCHGVLKYTVKYEQMKKVLSTEFVLNSSSIPIGIKLRDIRTNPDRSSSGLHPDAYFYIPFSYTVNTQENSVNIDDIYLIEKELFIQASAIHMNAEIKRISSNNQ